MNARDTLLLACGSTETRSPLRNLFENSFHLLETDNLEQTILFLNQNYKCIATMLVDITVPEKIHPEVIPQLRECTRKYDIPLLLIADDTTPSSLSFMDEWGAINIVSANYKPELLQRRVEKCVELYHYKWNQADIIKEQEIVFRRFNESLIDALSTIIEHRDLESGQHILRIRHFTLILLQEVAKNCPEYNLTQDQISIISSAASLHDIGKIAIPDSILSKQGPLTPEEWDVMKSHPLAGCQILETLNNLGDQEYLRYAHNICHYHHERWDGSGYPERIAGDDIPICAQVVGIADAYDALTTDRAYKKAIPCNQAAGMILNGECGSFSPKLLECFLHVTDQFQSLAQIYADGESPNNEDFNTALPAPDYQNRVTTLQRTHSKYLALIHHLDCTAFEIDLDQDLNYALYSPNLELSSLCSCATFEEASRVLPHLVVAEEHDQIRRFLSYDIPQFFENGTRKQIHYFHIRSGSDIKPIPYQFTMLRSDLNDPARRLLLLCQKLDSVVPASQEMSAQQVNIQLHEDTVHGLLTGLFRYRNNRWFTLESCGTRLPALLGYTDEEIQTQFHNHLIELVVPSDQEMVRQVIAEQLKIGTNVALGFRLRHKDGHSIWVLNKSHLVVEPDGNEYLYGTLTDITQTLQSQQEMHLNLERYQTILEQTETIIFEWDPVNDESYFSKHWEQILGYPPLRKNTLANLATSSHFHPEDMANVIQMFLDMKYGDLEYRDVEARLANAEGRYLWFRLRKTAVRDDDGKLLKMVGTIVNINEEKEAQINLKVQAEYDALTKLLNKHSTRKHTERFFLESGADLNAALLIIDLDNFKQVNDTYGHLFGDSILAQTAAEIKRQFRSMDIIGRIGGDEFMVLMRNTGSRELIEKRCSNLVESLRNIFDQQMDPNPMSCSIGVAIAPEHGTTYVDLFQHADHALYQTKKAGKNGFSFYDPTSALFSNIDSSVNTRIDSDEQPGLADRSLVQYAFQQLYHSDDTHRTINELLALIGRQMNVSRVYIFENTPDDKACNNTFEWCNVGILPEIDNLQNINYETDIPGFRELYNEQGILYCPDIYALPQEVYEIVASQNIKSMLHCAIMDHGVFRGYIGFDECTHNRIWTKDQINLLSFFSEMLSVVLLKKRSQDEAERQIEIVSSIMNNQNAWIYVIDPDTCDLKFVNTKTKEMAPDVVPGKKCYKSILGRDERCENCPARNIRQDISHEALITNRRFDLQVLAEATLIQWGNADACLVTCRKTMASNPPQTN